MVYTSSPVILTAGDDMARKLPQTPAAEFALDIRGDLFERGRNEDGQPRIWEAFYVVATGKYGERFAHDVTFKHPEYPSDQEAGKAAERLLARAVPAQKARTWQGSV